MFVRVDPWPVRLGTCRDTRFRLALRRHSRPWEENTIHLIQNSRTLKHFEQRSEKISYTVLGSFWGESWMPEILIIIATWKRSAIPECSGWYLGNVHIQLVPVLYPKTGNKYRAIWGFPLQCQWLYAIDQRLGATPSNSVEYPCSSASHRQHPFPFHL